MVGADTAVAARPTGTRALETLFAVAALVVAVGAVWYAVRARQSEVLFPAAVLTLILASIAILPGWSRSRRRGV